MTTPPLPPTPPPSLPAEASPSELVRRALMPDAAITHGLVQDSALQRIADFTAVAEVVRQTRALRTHHGAWDQAQAHLDALPLPTKVAVGSSPLYRNWLHLLGRALIEGAPLDALEPLLLGVGNYTQGLGDNLAGPALALAVRNGYIETWDCSAGLALPEDPPGGGTAPKPWHCQAMADGGWRLSAEGGSASLHLPPLQQRQVCLPASQIVVRNDLPSLRVTLDETRTPERNGSVRADAVDGRALAYPLQSHATIVEAAAALRAAWPAEYADWTATMRVVVPRLPPTGWRMEGFTLSSMQGASWINPASDVIAVMESLVHEHSHVKLRYIEDCTPLLAPDQDEARFQVGWRSDPRPLVGIFEGVYVHIHCAEALDRALTAPVCKLGARQTERAELRLAELRQQAREGLSLLRAHARFSPAGRCFIDWARASLDPGNR